MRPLLRMLTRQHFEALPGNMLSQWQQNIALRAENPSGQVARDKSLLFQTGWIFCDSNFLQVLNLLIFRQKQPGHWAEVVCHFHLLVSDLSKSSLQR